jgi:prepilin-type N-terminal cleavage/methylation domain-containing protein
VDIPNNRVGSKETFVRNRHKAFTLAEMLVVMGIILVFIAMAVPAVRSLTGGSSISAARNSMASLMNRAREEAVGIQDIRGVLFFVDPASDRVVGVICQAATIQDSNLTSQGIVLLDAVPGRDSLPLPLGVRLQMMFNGTNPSSSQTGADDRYLGFNPLNSTSGNPPFVGGCILFDGNGKLIVRQYGFQMSQPGPTGNFIASNLCTMLSNAYPAAGLTSTSGTISNGGSSAFIPTGAPATAPYSQLGLVLFDYDQFKTQGFSDLDADINGKGYTSAGSIVEGSVTQAQSEQLEETWIDQHSTPVLINRFNGTLIRGE